MAVQRPRLQGRGHVPGMFLQIGMNTASPCLKGSYAYTVSHADSACSLGAQKPLMAGKTQHVYMHPLHVNGKDSRCLGGVCHQPDSVSEAEFANTLQIHPVAGQVGGMGTHNCLCLRPYAFLQLVITQNSLFIAGQNRQADAPVFHQIKRPKHGIVLQYRGNHMVPF